MTTVVLGALKFNWRGNYSGATAYAVNDVVQSGGNAYICILANTGQAVSSTTYWNLMAQGSTVMTTTGDILYQDVAGATRLPVGTGGQTLVVTNGKPAWVTPDSYGSINPFQPPAGYGLTTDPANASAWLRTPWLISAANNYYADCALPSPACGPVKRSVVRQHFTSSGIAWLNSNREFQVRGSDSAYHFNGNDGLGATNGTKMNMNISAKYGGMRSGDYFVQLHSTYQGYLALTAQGDVFSIGYNNSGQCGTGDTVDKYAWTKVPYLGPDSVMNSLPCTIIGLHVGSNGQYEQADSGAYAKTVHAIDINGRLWAWGNNTYGQLGIGNTTTPISVPTLCVGVSNIRQVSGSGYHTLIVDSSGQAYSVGLNDAGQLGNGTTVNSSTFAPITGMTNVYQVEATRAQYYSAGWVGGTSQSFVLKNTGLLFSVGGNSANGELGDGTTASKTGFVSVGGSTTFSALWLNCGYNSVTCYVLGGTPGNSNKTLYCWGRNTSSQCGSGNQGVILAPTQPVSTTQNTNTLSSAINGAVGSTAAVYPRSDISIVMPQLGVNETGGGVMTIDATTQNMWYFGFSEGFDIVDNSSATSASTNGTPQKFPSPFTSNDAWVGTNSPTITDFACGGYAYGSNGKNVMQLSDGRMFGLGGNVYKELSDDALYSAQWRRITA